MLVILAIYASAGTGAIAVASIIRGREEEFLSDNRIMLYRIGSFIPFLDIVIAVYMWRAFAKR